MALSSLSGKVRVKNPANVSNVRYAFLSLDEAEPSLGMPAGNGFVLLGNVDGKRYWSNVFTGSGGGAGTSNLVSFIYTVGNGVSGTLASDTIFDGPDDNNRILAIADPKLVFVSLNGIQLIQGSSYDFHSKYYSCNFSKWSNNNRFSSNF